MTPTEPRWRSFPLAEEKVKAIFACSFWMWVSGPALSSIGKFSRSEGLAGEIGHLTLDLASNQQAEGMGFLERHLGRDALLASYRRVGGKANDIQTFLRDLKEESSRAKRMARLWGEWLTLAIRNLADLFNPKRVVLAGSLSNFSSS